MIEDPKENVFRRKPQRRTRSISLNGGTVFVNVLPPAVDLDKICYECKGHDVRVTDGSEWHLDIKEFGWT